MQGFRRFMKRLFSLRNLVPIIVIIGAAIGSLGLSPFGIQFTTEQITLALLGFLAVDALVERLDLLISIEQGIHAIQRNLTPQAVASAFFRRRRDFPRMEQLINEARDDIWVAGVSLDTMVTITKSFESKMREGCNIRFMAHAPRGNAVQPIADYYGTNPDFMSTRIKSNLSAIASRLRPTNGASIEIRTLDRVLPTGYFIIDPTSSKGRMIVQLYLYHTDPGEAPLFEISREVDELWFSTYLNQFEKAWNDATVFELSYPKPEGLDSTRALIPKDESVVLEDRFEGFTAWKEVGNGIISQSREISPRSGEYCLKKSGQNPELNNDPNGGFRDIGRMIGLGFVFSGWLYRPDNQGGGQANRLAIEDDQFNGYGFAVDHSKNVAYIERRDTGDRVCLGPEVSLGSVLLDQWYRFKFYVNLDGNLELEIFRHPDTEPLSITSASDKAYRSFSRVVVHGGYPYYVDDLKVRTL